MPKITKNILYYNSIKNMLKNTNLKTNIHVLWSAYIKDNYDENLKFTREKAKFKGNLYTAQVIELYREILVYSSLENQSKSIGDDKLFINFIELYKNLKESLLKNQKHKRISSVLFKLAHKQLWYQKIEYNISNYLNFYLNFYSNKKLDNEIKKIFGMGYRDLIVICYFLNTHYKMYFSFDFNGKDVIFKEKLPIIGEKLSLDINDLQNNIIAEANSKSVITNYEDLDSYGQDIIRYPIIRVDNTYCCVIPILVLYRVTTCVYYDFSEDFKQNVFGNINETFMFGLLEKNINKKYKIFNPNTYKHNFKNSPPRPDAIIEDEEVILFIEYKSNPLSQKSQKGEITDKDYNGRIKKNIIQVLKSIEFYENKIQIEENYFGLTKRKKIIIPIIFYIRNPYISIGDYVGKALKDIMNNKEISQKIVEEYYPLIFGNLSISNFVDIINHLGLKKFVEIIKSEKYINWESEAILDEILRDNEIIHSFQYEKDFLVELEEEEKKYIK